MGFQERWQSRQEELAVRGEVRDAEAAQRRNEFVERVQEPIVDQARRAIERGDGWFEVEIEQRNAGSLNPYGGTGEDHSWPPMFNSKTDHPAVSHSLRSDLLSRIEDVGWKLHTAQYVYIQLGEESRNKWLSSGQRVAIKGKIIGIYLFQRAQVRVERGQANFPAVNPE